MPQLHLYVPDDVAQELRERARSMRLTLSRYLAWLVKKEVRSGWPPGFFEEVVGGWKGKPLERGPQGELERREPL